MNIQRKKRSLWIMSFVIVMFFVFGAAYRVFSTLPLLDNSNDYPEIENLADKKTFPELSAFFAQLARKKGAVYAYKVLNTALLPPNTDLHLLGHVVGDVLFRQEGLKGIQKCTQDFRNACSHSIVVGLFLQDGEKALSQIADVCRKAPGG